MFELLLTIPIFADFVPSEAGGPVAKETPYLFQSAVPDSNPELRIILVEEDIAFTVTIAVPVTDPLVAFSMAVPGLDAVNFPEASTVPTVLLLLDQVTVAVNVFPYWSFGVAVKVWLSPTIKDLDGGETSIKFN